jgi:hypothetical protein
MGGLTERHPVQRIGPPARRQGAHHDAGQGTDGPVEGLRALDALGDRRRLG